MDPAGYAVAAQSPVQVEPTAGSHLGTPAGLKLVRNFHIDRSQIHEGDPRHHGFTASPRCLIVHRWSHVMFRLILPTPKGSSHIQRECEKAELSLVTEPSAGV